MSERKSVRSRKSLDYSKFDAHDSEEEDFVVSGASPRKKKKSVDTCKEKLSKVNIKKDDEDFEPEKETDEIASDNGTDSQSTWPKDNPNENSDTSDWENSKPPQKKKQKTPSAAVKVESVSKKSKSAKERPCPKSKKIDKQQASIPIVKPSPVPLSTFSGSKLNLTTSSLVSPPLIKSSPLPLTPAPTNRPLTGTALKTWTPPTRVALPGSTSVTPGNASVSSVTPKTPGSGGLLRLGLSRNRSIKPLHSNIRISR